MKHLSVLAFALGMALVVPAYAADQARDQTRAAEQDQDRERVYGAELMTSQERSAYHKQMRALKTDQARETFRLEHHKQMQARARAQGKVLPDMPPAGYGGGMGSGSGMGGPGPRR